MVATIAPGPAKIGVPSGTKAMFEFESSPYLEVFPVKSSRATNKSKSAPAACSASMEILRYPKINRPKRAKIEMTRSETAAACIARIRRTRADLSATNPKKIGVAPGGSIITNNVTKD